MAPNNFATMLHRNTNKITFVLVYAILEWILIILLLLNSLFSYLIIKFADFFGLKRPCLWCTRIDHILEPGKNKNPCRDLVCEAHGNEISKLGFCSNHLKLAESQGMCEDCSSSSKPEYVKLSKSFGFFPWMNQIGMNMVMEGDDGKVIEKVDDEPLRCSCCEVNLDNRLYPPCILINPSSKNILGYPEEQNLVTEGRVDAEIDEGDDQSDHSRSDFVLDHHGDEHGTEENRGIKEEGDESCGCSVCDGVRETLAYEIYKSELGVEKGKGVIKSETLDVPNDDVDQLCEQKTAQVDCMIQEIPHKHLEFFIHGDDCRLIPVELVDFKAIETQNQHGYKGEDEDFILDFNVHADAETEPAIENWHMSRDSVTKFSSHVSKEELKSNEVESIQLRNREQSSEFEGEEENLEQKYHELRFAQTAEEFHKYCNVETNMESGDGELCFDFSLVSEVATQMQGEKFEAEVSLGTETHYLKQVDEYQFQATLLDTNQQIQEDLSTSTVRFRVQDDSGRDKGEDFVELNTMSVEVKMPTVNNHLSSSTSLEFHVNEGEKFPDTPTSVETMHYLHKKLLLLERKDSGTEDSLDGSIMSDIEYGEVTIEKLKSALKSERKALSTLYAELEEERSASAIAANETMAMINRLQEEKAAMQMEALQYQRMMDEQSEYDQEALQILNELMIKREKENQELEKELEIYRKKFHEYEVHCRNAEDSDGLSIDLNHHEENRFYSHQECSNKKTPEDAVLYLDESLANFEEERLSILEHLKVLEEKLLILNYGEEHHFKDVKSNGYHDHDNRHVNGYENGHANGVNGKHHYERNIIGIKAKMLLPLFDAISNEESEVVELSGDGNELKFSPLQNGSSEKVHLDKKKVALEEEVDHVYERLQVLEADREFLKHCISSLRKGDKGLDLLREILQHLRDLRNVELRFRNMGDFAV
ncbi:PREDICTED: myosin-binding protein 3-like isoform X2 [Lupinus angustifolius]|uniref:myosin-binding protein 3-like isoform X2 n=1 Tax=Lupinus angustifolius TaxID=3871 RepID=UPI00092E705A|nr:PREDICTED: myosin-binding protein 3-like isoform X2 [Lupinus angustifolius]